MKEGHGAVARRPHGPRRKAPICDPGGATLAVPLERSARAQSSPPRKTEWGPMFDHVSVIVSDFARSKAFYLAALAHAGHSRLVEQPSALAAGFCHADGSDFWISQGSATRPAIHIAFRVPSRAAVDAFHEAAIAAGGRDNGAPGLRPQYHPSYYGAFVLDPDGHNIEAVCHEAS